jgi:hypothetical protein
MASDRITDGLARTTVKVVAYASALQAANFARSQASAGVDPIKALSEETRSAIVITGSYDRVPGDSIEFKAEIVDGQTATQRAPIEPVRASAGNVGEAITKLRDRVMAALSILLDERLSLPPSPDDRPPSFAAWRAFDRGLDDYLRREDRLALPNLYKAYQTDSNFILPLLYAAFAHSNLGEAAPVDSLTRLISARKDELTAYDRYWAEYLEARLAGDNNRALVAMRDASKLAPESKATYQWAFMGQITNRLSESEQAFAIIVPERGAMRGWAPYWNIRAEVQHRLGNFDAEYESGTQARQLYPERPDPRQIQISALAAEGKLRELNEMIEASRAAPTDTLTTGHIMAYAAVELQRHRYDNESKALFDQALQWFSEHPTLPYRDSIQYMRDHTEVLINAKRWQEARTVIERLLKTEPERAQYRAWLGVVAAGAGKRDEALELEQWLAQTPSVRLFHGRSNTYQRARIWALLGDKQRALHLVNQAFEEGFGIPRHPDVAFEKMRDDKDLQTLFAPRK